MPKRPDIDPNGEPLRDTGIRCDFCGEYVPTVRRVALDRGYERLQTPHKERYACERCSAAKEAERRGLSR
jgi:hypothetical protein